MSHYCISHDPLRSTLPITSLLFLTENKNSNLDKLVTVPCLLWEVVTLSCVFSATIPDPGVYERRGDGFWDRVPRVYYSVRSGIGHGATTSPPGGQEDLPDRPGQYTHRVSHVTVNKEPKIVVLYYYFE